MTRYLMIMHVKYFYYCVYEYIGWTIYKDSS